MDDSTNPEPRPVEAEDPKDGGAVVEPPEDTPEDASVGYAVYDTTVGQFVGAVKRGGSKPSQAEVKRVVPKGHAHAVVRV